MTDKDEQNKQTEGYYGGESYNNPPPNKGLSGWLIVLLVVGGLCSLISVVAVVAAIAIPNLMEARKHGNEAAAMGSLRTINASQAIYIERSKSQKYGNLQDLGNDEYLDTVLAAGTKNGYKFEVWPSPSNPNYEYWVKASPVKPGETGERFFYTNQTGAIHFSKSDFDIDRATGKPSKYLQAIGGR
jgi:type II secretory pathway pseudopilin PulG